MRRSFGLFQKQMMENGQSNPWEMGKKGHSLLTYEGLLAIIISGFPAMRVVLLRKCNRLILG